MNEIERRAVALEAASRYWQGYNCSQKDVIETAMLFDEYMVRGRVPTELEVEEEE